MKQSPEEIAAATRAAIAEIHAREALREARRNRLLQARAEARRTEKARQSRLSEAGLPALVGVGSGLGASAARRRLKVLRGNIGRAVIKTSAVQPQHRIVEAPAVVFDDQGDVITAFKAGELSRDCVVVVRYQGPRANGMPELHQLTPALSSLQSKGYKVALVTDGRMSGASGAIPAAIHVSPECAASGPLGKVRDGDVIRLDSYAGTLEIRVPDDVLRGRTTPAANLERNAHGIGRELFASFRRVAGDAEQGAMGCM